MEDGSGQRRARRRNMRDEGGGKLNGGALAASASPLRPSHTAGRLRNSLVN